ncbi:XdhC family protein [Hyphomicrobium sp.]|uniref:XdhC family protein n=1 Tax=Hyphomicrobium sp. TaxID=82 RepID=UPI000F916DEB|nr:XdhC family protein [Hyphomicrobium sp.]RUO99863.1 MAG: XdhC family protein [Hyphomicrobium sp.]
MTDLQATEPLEKSDAPITNPRAAARAWLEAGRPVAMATVIDTWGSATVRTGGQMAIADVEEFQGSVSGGCVEADVIAAAIDVIDTGKPEILSFGIADETAWRAGLACGGKIRVHIAKLDPQSDLTFLDELDKAAAARKPIVVTTRLADGHREIHDGTASVDPVITEAVRRAQSGVDKDGQNFVHALTPPPRIVIVGATHIGQHLATMATASGYDVKVIDPRTAFANPTRFNPSQLIAGWPEECFKKLTADPFSAVVTLTHVDHIDDEALTIALKSPCRYIGSLGSRRTHAKRVERLKAAGFTDADIARIHAPVGMPIEAVTAGEIATSILAQIIAAFRKEPAAA